MPIVLNHSILEDIGWAAVDDMASSVGGFRTILPQLQHLLLKRRRQRIGAEERSQCLSSCDLLKKKKTNKQRTKKMLSDFSTTKYAYTSDTTVTSVL